MGDEKNKIKWYQKKEIWGISLFITGGIKHLTKPHTIVHQLADYSFTIGIPLLLTFFGVKDGYKNNSLPSGLSKLITNKK